jgi:hypothetical protein
VRVFHIRDLNYYNLPIQNSNALNVFLTLEPPTKTYFWLPPFGNQLRDYFNWTITYRSTSDIYYPYDAFVELDGSEKEDEIWTDKQVN